MIVYKQKINHLKKLPTRGDNQFHAQYKEKSWFIDVTYISAKTFLSSSAKQRFDNKST